MEHKQDLPGCSVCNCPADNHVIPPENTEMEKKCLSCNSGYGETCSGYKPKVQCPDCDGTSIALTLMHHQFEYGDGINRPAVLLDAGQVPVFQCDSCSFMWTDYRTEEIVAVTVQKHLAEVANEKAAPPVS